MPNWLSESCQVHVKLASSKKVQLKEIEEICKLSLLWVVGVGEPLVIEGGDASKCSWSSFGLRGIFREMYLGEVLREKWYWNIPCIPLHLASYRTHKYIVPVLDLDLVSDFCNRPFLVFHPFLHRRHRICHTHQSEHYGSIHLHTWTKLCLEQCPMGTVFRYRVRSGAGKNTRLRVRFGSSRVPLSLSVIPRYFWVFRISSLFWGEVSQIKVFF